LRSTLPASARCHPIRRLALRYWSVNAPQVIAPLSPSPTTSGRPSLAATLIWRAASRAFAKLNTGDPSRSRTPMREGATVSGKRRARPGTKTPGRALDRAHRGVLGGGWWAPISGRTLPPTAVQRAKPMDIRAWPVPRRG
jgi:hypothetical protein